MRTTTITVIVLFLTSLLLGHTTFFSSLFVSLKYLPIPLKKFLTLSKKETFFAPSFFLGLSL